MQGLRAISQTRANGTSCGRAPTFPQRLPGGCFACNPFGQHEGVVKLPQNVLQILEALHGRGAATEQGAIQLGGVAKPATAPANCVQGHRGEVTAQRAQFFERRPSVLPARTSQAQGSFARIHPAARHQDVQVLAQPSRIEFRECPGQLPVRPRTLGGKPVAHEAHDQLRNLGSGRLFVEKRSTDVEIAALAGQPGQCAQSLERASHPTPCWLLRSHGQAHAQPARGDPDLVNWLLLPGLGAGQVGEQPLHVLVHELRGGPIALLARGLHGAASLE